MNKRQQQKEETARRLFEAALRLFREQGYAATTVDQIVHAAGVAKGTFFTHFASKDALLDHIGAVQMRRIGLRIGADPAFAGRDACAQLHVVAAAMADGLAEQPAEMRALTAEILARRSLLDVEPLHVGELDRLLEQIIAGGQARGELRADAPAARLATLVRGAYFLGVFAWIQGEHDDLAALVGQHIDLVLGGITSAARRNGQGQ